VGRGAGVERVGEGRAVFDAVGEALAEAEWVGVVEK
jgi:hypothetical protein